MDSLSNVSILELYSHGIVTVDYFTLESALLTCFINQLATQRHNRPVFRSLPEPTR